MAVVTLEGIQSETVIPQGVFPLTELPAQMAACIDTVEASTSVRAKLEGLGICAGRRIRLIKKGDPYLVGVYGSCVGLSPVIASCVRVVSDES